MGGNGLKDSVWQYSMTIYDYNSTIMIDTLPIKSHTTTMDDSVTVDTTQTEIGFEVLDALNVADLPGDEPYQVQDITIDAEAIDIRLGRGPNGRGSNQRDQRQDRPSQRARLSTDRDDRLGMAAQA